MHQRDKSLVGKFFFPSVSDCDLGGTLECDIALICLEGVSGQAFDQASAFDAANGSTPSVLCESVSETRAQGVRGIPPQILAVIGAIDAFFIIESLDPLSSSSVG